MKPIKAPRAPRTTEQATVLADKYAALAGVLASIETERASALASTNAVADALASPVLEEQRLIAAVLEPWWAANAAELTKGKRKSIELGGCMIGTVAGRSSLTHGLADDNAAVDALRAARLAKTFVRVSYSLDKAELKKGLDGRQKDKLGEIGFSIKPGAETFFIERVAQAGVVGA
jgi:phage host-nuclease inhibitor protein Gam